MLLGVCQRLGLNETDVDAFEVENVGEILQDWLVRQTTAGTANTVSQARFNAFLSQSNAGMPGNLTNAAKEALFQQFLIWDKQRPAAR
jgi:hypothetical protein